MYSCYSINSKLANKLNSRLDIKSKPLSTGTTNLVASYKITSIILVLVMFSHFTFMHTIIHDYVLCYGNDGHVEIENVSECLDCSPHSMLDTQVNSTQLSSNQCNDKSIDDNCFEEEEYLTQNKTLINRSIQKSKKLSFPKWDPENSSSLKNINVLENNILENYSNISLLI